MVYPTIDLYIFTGSGVNTVCSSDLPQHPQILPIMSQDSKYGFDTVNINVDLFAYKYAWSGILIELELECFVFQYAQYVLIKASPVPTNLPVAPVNKM